MSTIQKNPSQEMEDFDLDDRGPNWKVVIPVLVIMIVFAILSFWAW